MTAPTLLVYILGGLVGLVFFCLMAVVAWSAWGTREEIYDEDDDLDAFGSEPWKKAQVLKRDKDGKLSALPQDGAEEWSFNGQDEWHIIPPYVPPKKD